MTSRPLLTEYECLALVDNASEALTSDNKECALAAIIEHLRLSFDVTCAAIREVISRPCTLRYTYESIDDTGRPRRINETCTFEESVWQYALAHYHDGSYVYRADDGQTEPLLLKPAPEFPLFMVQIPMFVEGKFLGVLELLDFDRMHELCEHELTTLGIVAKVMSRHLYHTNPALVTDEHRQDIDSLTGLMNFHAFTEELDRQLPEMITETPVAVVYTDIHHFKYINETYGYKKGDELLKLTAQAFVQGSGDHHVIRCRAHADHFITAAGVQKDLMHTFANFIHQQNEALSKLLQAHCPDVQIRMLTGICYVDDPGMTAATAIANANLARKLAKAENIHTPLVFSDEMMEEIKYQEYLNNELPKAIKNHDLKVYYQPKINCLDDSLYGAEALVRWQKPDGSFIYPDKFIPVFEKNGNIMEVDFYVYREVFRYLRKRLDKGLPVFPISMNVSRVHFRSDRIIPYIRSLLEEYRIPPELVEFELTENIYMQNFTKADAFIKTLRSLGIQVSMDDFGSGYSSLNVISTLRIDTLKIDKIFLKSDDLSDSDKTVIECMIAMAKRLGMKVICEGVETESQTLFLKKAQCDQIQGYYYGRPMDEDSFDLFAGKLLERLEG